LRQATRTTNKYLNKIIKRSNKLMTTQQNCKIMQFVKILFCLTVFFTITSSFAGITYYVDGTNGNNSLNDGKSVGAAWKTIQKAASTMVAGDTVKILAGTYRETVTPANSGTSSAYITYTSYGNGEVIIDGENSRSRCIYIPAGGRDYLKFQYLTLKNTNKALWGAGFMSYYGSDNIILDTLKVIDCRFGIYFSGGGATGTKCSNITIKNCTIEYNSYHGIFFFRQILDSEIANCTIRYNGSDNDGGRRKFGIEIGTNFSEPHSYGAQRIIVKDNVVRYNYGQGLRTWQADDILIDNNNFSDNGYTGYQLEHGTRNAVIRNNEFSMNCNDATNANTEAGLWIAGGTDNNSANMSYNILAENNTSSRNKMGFKVSGNSQQVILRKNISKLNNRGMLDLTITCGFFIDGTAKYVKMYNNTLYKDGHSSSYWGALSLGVWNYPSSMTIKNNIISTFQGDCEISNFKDLTGYESDNNCFYNTRALSFRWSGIVGTLAQYSSASGADGASINDNPLFTNPDNGDFSLTSDSPCINEGEDLTYANGSGSNSRYLYVDDARYFFAGNSFVNGDSINVGGVTGQISSIDYGNKKITLVNAISWSNNAPVNLQFFESAPDIGAVEYNAGGGANGELTIQNVTVPVNDSTKVNIYDADTSSEWHNSGTPANGWFKLDLGSVESITKIRYKDDYSRSLKIEIDSVLIFNGPTNSGGGYTEITVPATSGRYITFTLQAGNWIVPEDVEVYGIVKLPIQNATVAVNESIKTNIYDTDTASAWHNSKVLANGWFTLDMGAEKTITKIRYKDDYARSLKIDIDGVLIFDGSTDSGGGYTEITVPATSGRYITFALQVGLWIVPEDVEVYGY
jgi:parallel beta-helix repeat protein